MYVIKPAQFSLDFELDVGDAADAAAELVLVATAKPPRHPAHALAGA